MRWSQALFKEGGNEAASKAPLLRTHGIKRPGDSSVPRWFWCRVGIDCVTDHVDDENSAAPLQDHFAPLPPPSIAVLSVHMPCVAVHSIRLATTMHHGPRTRALGRRGFALESGAARVCREAGV